MQQVVTEIPRDRSNMGARLKECRQSRRMSLRAAAERIGISRTTLWRLEEGLDPHPTFDTLHKCATYYRVSTDYLRGVDESLESTLDYTPERAQQWIREAVHRKDLAEALAHRRGAGQRLKLVLHEMAKRFGNVFEPTRLAERLGIKPAVLADLLDGRTNVSARSDAFVTVCEEIGLPPRLFITGELGPSPELIEEVCALRGATEYLQAIKLAHMVGCGPKRLMALLHAFEVVDDAL